jgi:uncharacterized OB-fold protein
MLWFHRCKLGKVEADGYQYCSECGKAHLPPKPNCIHKWDTISSELDKQVDGTNAGFLFKKGRVVMRCLNCGEITQRDIV